MELGSCFLFLQEEIKYIIIVVVYVCALAYNYCVRFLVCATHKKCKKCTQNTQTKTCTKIHTKQIRY